MKSIILYGSFTKLTNAHKPVHTVGNLNPPNNAQPQPNYYVRMETFDGDCSEALSNAHPQPGELFLNTHEIPE